MDINTILDLAREQTYSNAGELDNATLINYLNTVYRDIISSVTEMDESFLFQEITVNLVANQSEYTLPANFEKVIDIYRRFEDSADDKYVKMSHRDLSTFDRSPDLLLTDTHERNTFYTMLEDYKIRIYSQPEINITDGLKLWGTIIPTDLSVAGAESTIVLKPKYHDVLWMGVKQYIYQLRGLVNEKNDAKNEYALEKKKVLNQLVPRKVTPDEAVLPSLETLA